LTLKPELIFVNIGEDRIGKPLPEELLKVAPNAIQAPAKLEMELAELSDEDRQAFMQDLNLTGFSKDETLNKIFPLRPRRPRRGSCTCGRGARARLPRLPPPLRARPRPALATSPSSLAGPRVGRCSTLATGSVSSRTAAGCCSRSRWSC